MFSGAVESRQVSVIWALREVMARTIDTFGRPIVWQQLQSRKSILTLTQYVFLTWRHRMFVVTTLARVGLTKTFTSGVVKV